MLDEFLSIVIAGPAWLVALKLGAIVAGFMLGVRLLAGGGCTADERDRTLLDAVRRHRQN